MYPMQSCSVAHSVYLCRPTNDWFYDLLSHYHIESDVKQKAEYYCCVNVRHSNTFTVSTPYAANASRWLAYVSVKTKAGRNS